MVEVYVPDAVAEDDEVGRAIPVEVCGDWDVVGSAAKYENRIRRPVPVVVNEPLSLAIDRAISIAIPVEIARDRDVARGPAERRNQVGRDVARAEARAAE